MRTAVLELKGQESFSEAIEEIVLPDGPDIIVIRQFLANPDALRQLRGSLEGFADKPASEVLDEYAPVLRASEKIAQDQWTMFGYTDYKLEDAIRITGRVDKDIEPYLAEVFDPQDIDALALGSLCLDGRRRFSAERFPERYSGAFGRFDIGAYREDTVAEDARYNDVILRGVPPATSVELEAGDMAIIAEMPATVLRSTTNLDPTATALLVGWTASQQ